jgi:hypothetical protein
MNEEPVQRRLDLKTIALAGCVFGPCLGCPIGAIGIVVLALVLRIPLVSVGFGFMGTFYFLIAGGSVGAVLGSIVAVVLVAVYDKKPRQ